METSEPEAEDLLGMAVDIDVLAPAFEDWAMRQAEPRLTSSSRVAVDMRQPRHFREVPDAVPELPASPVAGGRWGRVVVGAWQARSAIHLKGAWCSLLALKREARWRPSGP